MTKKAVLILRSLFLAIPLAVMAMDLSALDFPHAPANTTLSIGCLSCHDLHGSLGTLLKPAAANPDMDGDDTEANNLCWSCHVVSSTPAPYKVPHSSDQISIQHGTWNVECKDCHDPHSQPQFAYGGSSYLATGTLTAVVSGGTSTLTDTSQSWTVDEHAGRVVFPDVNARDRRGRPIGDLSYRVLSNTADTLTVDGAVNVSYIAAGDTYGVIYGKLIRNQIKVPSTTTWKQVKFFGQTGANSFADDDATLDGVCQVCHTKTGHFKNDGTGADQMHSNADRGDPNGTAGENCTEKCHKHIGGFGHGKGYTKVDLCVQCHGHEEGTYYMRDGKYPYNPDAGAMIADPDPDSPTYGQQVTRLSSVTSRGFGSTRAHSTHTESWVDSGTGWGAIEPAANFEDDKRGPGIYCDRCHDINNMPRFKSGVSDPSDPEDPDEEYFSLAETDVCDKCHSPEGTYNGVDSVGESVGAKTAWTSDGVYSADNDTLKPGKEKWCAGCHDERHEAYGSNPQELYSSHIDLTAWDTEVGINRNINVYAPPVIGDEDGVYNYGVGWGFFKTGHGTPSDSYIPATGGGKNGPGKACFNCHNPRERHIDGNQRSFDCSDGCDADEYQTSYRLKYPMQVPLTDGYVDPNESNYQLCFSCHDFESITDTANSGTSSPNTTNFYTTDEGDPKNLHFRHLDIGDLKVSADWGNSWNSKPTCITCHNPHGTTNFSMIRTGKILEVDPSVPAGLKAGLNLWYGNSKITSLPSGNNPPDPSNLTLSASDRSYFWGPIGTGDPATGYCASDCHGTMREIIRDPLQETDQTPFLDWLGDPGYESDGVSPDVVEQGVDVTFKVKYMDWDGDAPVSIYVWVDLDNDDVFEVGTERFAMTAAAGQTMPYSYGWEYAETMVLTKVGDGLFKYYFEATDADGSATGPATEVNTLRIVNAVPELNWTAEAGYENDGINPDVGGDGASFTFRVTYSDGDAEAPSSILFLEDLDLDGTADNSYAMTPVAGGDYLTGKIYTYSKVINYADTTAGSAQYAFSASDGADAATGDPTGWSSFTVLSSSNTPAVLEWEIDAADCRTDSAKPNKTLLTGIIDFRVKYTDIDNNPPTSVSLQVDLDGDGTYEDGASPDEVIPLTLVAGGDSDWSNGEFYEATSVIPVAAGSLKYRFVSVDGGGAAAVGDPTTTDKFLTLYANDGTAKGVRKSPAASGSWYNVIQTAIDVAGVDTVYVDQGLYEEDLKMDNWTAVDYANTTIRSLCGADITTIDPVGATTRPIWTRGNSLGTIIIDGFEISGGTTGVYVETADAGAVMDIRNSKVHSNNARGIQSAIKLLLSDSEVYSNTGGNGAGVYISNGSNHAFTDAVIRNNSSTAAGGGLFVQGATGAINLTNVTIEDNTAATNGGGAYFASSATISFDKSTLSGNQAANAGAAYLADPVTMTNCVVSDNSATTDGGAFYSNGGSLTFNNGTLVNNSAGDQGGAVYLISNSVAITNSIIWGNTAVTNGDAVWNNYSTFSIVDAVIQNDGDPDLDDEPVIAPTAATTPVTGTLFDTDPNFLDEASRDYRIQPISDAIDNAGAGATADDRDGNARTDADLGAYEYIASGAAASVPELTWTAEANFISDGVHPDRATGGSTFEFRVDYTDSSDAAPAPMELWLDANDNGAFEETEKHVMTKLTGSTDTFDDGDFSNGERYTYTSDVLYFLGDGFYNYRFFSAAGSNVATGDPAAVNQVQVDNAVPVLDWVGDANYVSDGVHPNEGVDGGDFVFRVTYSDIDDMAPVLTQVWVDLDDDFLYDDIEKFDMTKEGAGTDYRGGETYTSAPITINSAGDDSFRFRFYFTDGEDDATGAPAVINLAKDRYSRYVAISDNPTTITTATAVPTPGVDGSIDVSMGFSGDADANNSYTVRYCVQSSCGSWTDHLVDVAHTASPYTTSITGLTAGETYKVQMTYMDDYVSGTNPVEVADILLPYISTTPGVATASAKSLTSLTLSMPYTNDANDNNNYTVEYKLTSQPTVWTTWAPDPHANAVSPFSTDITSLISGETYDVRMTYNDADGFLGGQPVTQTVSSITLVNNGTTTGTATAVFAGGTSIDVEMPYTDDANTNNTYTVEYKLSSEPTVWTTWAPDPHAHAATPFATSITGLTVGSTYDVRVTYNDVEGIIGGTQQQTISSIVIPLGDQVVDWSDCAGSNHCTIQAGIDAAIDGHVVVVLPGTYAEKLTLGINAGVDDVNITLKSRDGASSVTVTGTGADDEVFEIAGGNTSTIQGLTINNSRVGGNNPRGVYINGASPIFDQSIIEGQRPATYVNGAGVWIQTGSPTFKRTWVRDNGGASGKGIYCRDGTVTIINSIFSGNGRVDHSLAGTGAGLYVHYSADPALLCTATIINSTFSGNLAQKGGGIWGPGTVIAKYSIFWGNLDETWSSEDQIKAGYTVSYSVVEGAVYPGNGNVANDPMFVTEIDPATAPFATGNYYLQGYTYTPDAVLDLTLIDPDTLDPQTPTDDYSGNSRPSGTSNSMGAYEWIQ